MSAERLLIIGLFLITTQRLSGAEVIDLTSFPKTSDSIVNRCFENARQVTQKGKDLCRPISGDYFICPKSKAARFESLESCRVAAKDATDKVAMLYLLGLLHQDFRYEPPKRECPEDFRYQEGSGVCVYTDKHFHDLISGYPNHRFADMAEYKIAESAYRSYECEGQVLCAVENAITGWKVFLKNRSSSPFASDAVDRIVSALDTLSKPGIDFTEEYPAGLVKDIDDLSSIVPALSKENGEKLSLSLTRAGKALKGMGKTPSE